MWGSCNIKIACWATSACKSRRRHWLHKYQGHSSWTWRHAFVNKNQSQKSTQRYNNYRSMQKRNYPKKKSFLLFSAQMPWRLTTAKAFLSIFFFFVIFFSGIGIVTYYAFSSSLLQPCCLFFHLALYSQYEDWFIYPPLRSWHGYFKVIRHGDKTN